MLNGKTIITVTQGEYSPAAGSVLEVDVWHFADVGCPTDFTYARRQYSSLTNASLDRLNQLALPFVCIDAQEGISARYQIERNGDFRARRVDS